MSLFSPPSPSHIYRRERWGCTVPSCSHALLNRPKEPIKRWHIEEVGGAHGPSADAWSDPTAPNLIWWAVLMSLMSNPCDRPCPKLVNFFMWAFLIHLILILVLWLICRWLYLGSKGACTLHISSKTSLAYFLEVKLVLAFIWIKRVRNATLMIFWLNWHLKTVIIERNNVRVGSTSMLVLHDKFLSTTSSCIYILSCFGE